MVSVFQMKYNWWPYDSFMGVSFHEPLEINGENQLYLTGNDTNYFYNSLYSFIFCIYDL